MDQELPDLAMEKSHQWGKDDTKGGNSEVNVGDAYYWDLTKALTNFDAPMMLFLHLRENKEVRTPVGSGVTACGTWSSSPPNTVKGKQGVQVIQWEFSLSYTQDIYLALLPNITDHSFLNISIHDPILPRKVLHDSRYTGS